MCEEWGLGAWHEGMASTQEGGDAWDLAAEMMERQDMEWRKLRCREYHASVLPFLHWLMPLALNVLKQEAVDAVKGTVSSAMESAKNLASRVTGMFSGKEEL